MAAGYLQMGTAQQWLYDPLTTSFLCSSLMTIDQMKGGGAPLSCS